MGLAERLATDNTKQPGLCRTAKQLATLPEADQAAFDEWFTQWATDPESVKPKSYVCKDVQEALIEAGHPDPRVSSSTFDGYLERRLAAQR